MKDANRHRDPASYRGGGADPAVLSELRRQEWARRSPEEKERHLASFIAAGQVHNRRSSGTRIELVVAAMLDDLGVHYRRNTQVGRHNVDFLAGRVIVECFGDFWHCNPALWAAGDYNRSLHMTAGEKWVKDARRREQLEGKGFRFVALWEADIQLDPDTVRRLLTTMLTEEGDDAAQA
jgi:G:T-mismatch repair DNA endonuclease (very short patch repair protein)